MVNKIDEVLLEASKAWKDDAVLGFYIRQLQQEIKVTIFDRTRVEKALHLGSRISGSLRPNSRDKETERRISIRACILAELIMKKKYVDVDSLKKRLQQLPEEALRQRFKITFPLISNEVVRASWLESFFTDPRHHNDVSFRYIIHGLKPPSADDGTLTPVTQILKNPDLIRSWIAISCSVIDQIHSSTFYESGLILKVPSQNILTTASVIQFFNNHAGIGSPSDPPTTNRVERAGLMLNHIMQKNAEFGGLKTPDEILRRTATTGSNSVNEVVIRGTGVSVSGFFIRVDHQGEMEWDSSNDPRFIRRERDFREASLALGIPIVYLKPSRAASRPHSRSGSNS